MTSRLVHWRPAHEPAPPGWRKARQRKSHHNRHSVLTEPELARADRRGRGATAPSSQDAARSTPPGASASRKDRRGALLEDQIHVQVADYLRLALRSPDVWWTTIPAGGGGKVRGALLKRKGYTKGTPDILIVFRGLSHWIEMKRPGEHLTADQEEQHRALRRAGSVTGVCWSVADVYSTICAWGLPVEAKPT